ncbi:hypothetical protein GH733_003044 [Mirounga leonina]|nr:hypothetical protein GH733_003044 [Mirounga leonina]
MKKRKLSITSKRNMIHYPKKYDGVLTYLSSPSVPAILPATVLL